MLRGLLLHMKGANKMNNDDRGYKMNETLADPETTRTALEEQAWMYLTEFSPDYLIE